MCLQLGFESPWLIWHGRPFTCRCIDHGRFTPGWTPSLAGDLFLSQLPPPFLRGSRAIIFFFWGRRSSYICPFDKYIKIEVQKAEICFIRTAFYSCFAFLSPRHANCFSYSSSYYAYALVAAPPLGCLFPGEDAGRWQAGGAGGAGGRGAATWATWVGLVGSEAVLLFLSLLSMSVRLYRLW